MKFGWSIVLLVSILLAVATPLFFGHALVEQGTNNIVISTDGHLVGVIGVSELVVVHTEGATLVCPKDKAQEIKALLQRIKQDPEKRQFL